MDTSHAPPARQVNAWAQRRGRPTRAQKLAAAARAAADVRAYDTDPDVVALRIERLRTRVDRLIWTGLILGLSFTMANVQRFASRGKTPDDIEWWIAWLLDPMVSLVLIGVLLGEQIIARHQIRGGRWIRRTKWTCLAATYAMNTWSSWAALNPADIVLHSVPPVIVFCAAEAVTTLKHQITAAVHRAYLWAAERMATINEATAEAAARAKAVADTHAADPEEGTRALADLKAWAQRRITGAEPTTQPTTSVASPVASPAIDATETRPEPRPAMVAPSTPLSVVDPVATPVATEDEYGDQTHDRDGDQDGDRERPDDQDNSEAEEWIRRQCRGRNGVGRRPTKTDVAKRFGFSETWGLTRVQNVQKQMTAQGYTFESDRAVYAPTRSVADSDASSREEATAS